MTSDVENTNTWRTRLRKLAQFFEAPPAPPQAPPLTSEIPTPDTLKRLGEALATETNAIRALLIEELGDVISPGPDSKPVAALSTDELWSLFWWDAVRRNLGLQGTDSLRDMTVVAFLRVAGQYQENATEVYRAQRRVLGFVSFDRFMEERDFRVFRTALEKRIEDLARELDAAIDNAESLLTEKLPVIEALEQRVRLDPISAEYVRHNCGQIRARAATIAASAREIRRLLQDKETLSHAIDELRQINGKITDQWGTWQRRLKHGLLAAGITLALLVVALFISGRWALLSVVPASEWLVANTWRLALAGVASYILIRMFLGQRVSRLRENFGLFDPDASPGSALARCGDLALLKDFKAHLVEEQASQRKRRYARRYALALLAPGFLVASVSLAFPLLTGDSHVVLKSASGSLCSGPSGKTVFAFPTYRVIQSGDGMHLVRMDDVREISDVTSQIIPPCPAVAEAGGDRAGLTVSAQFTARVQELEASETTLRSDLQLLQLQLNSALEREAARPIQVTLHPSVKGEVSREDLRRLEDQIQKSSDRLSMVDGAVSQTIAGVLAENAASTKKLSESLNQLLRQLATQVCVEAVQVSKASLAGLSPSARARLEKKLSEECGVNFTPQLDKQERPAPHAVTTR